MEVAKLTLSPIIKNGKNIVIQNPSNERATRLLKESLEIYTGKQTKPKFPRKKLPEWIRDFINPKSWVGSVNSEKL